MAFAVTSCLDNTNFMIYDPIRHYSKTAIYLLFNTTGILHLGVLMMLLGGNENPRDDFG